MPEQTEQTEQTLYFAYGMNLDPDSMPESRFRKVGAAWCPDWRLDFAYYADIVRNPGRGCWGGLWEVIGDNAEHFLDWREGYDPNGNGLYDKTTVKVQAGAGDYEAMAYYMTAHMRLHYADQMPDAGYLGIMIRGYDYFGLPLEHMAAALPAPAISTYEQMLEWERAKEIS